MVFYHQGVKGASIIPFRFVNNGAKPLTLFLKILKILSSKEVLGMRRWFNNLFIGRQGMDELSKAMFWWGLAGLLLSGLTVSLLNGVLASLLSWLGLLLIILCFVRAFSRQLQRRELENNAYLAWVEKKRRQWEGKKDRFRQRKDFKFFKCPGCGTILRVPRGKGKIHINCRCGYVLYRKT